MTDPRPLCARCGLPVFWLDPVTQSVVGFALASRAFCSSACASAWACAEVVRLDGWLRAIASTRGYGGHLASIARSTSGTAAEFVGAPRRKSKMVEVKGDPEECAIANAISANQRYQASLVEVAQILRTRGADELELLDTLELLRGMSAGHERALQRRRQERR
ncbi:MAG TPA: hypothetical protein VLC53_04525 [Myxococcota bacterium]|nr:hypothetical protein [Myxococcota bacterium]